MIIFHLSSYTDHLTDDGVELTKRPYPFGVDLGGKIFNHYEEDSVAGFQFDAAVQRIDLSWDDYIDGDHQVVVGKYLITVSKKGRLATQLSAIERVEVRE